MSFIITSVLSFLMAHRYFSLFVITFFAAFLIPLPSNVSVMTAASFVSQGYFNIYLVFLVALAGNVAGDLAMYGLARLYGRKILERFYFFRRIFNSPKYDEYEKKVEAYAPITIIISRFVTEVNPLVNIVCGVLPVHFGKYFLYEFFGEILDVSAFVLVGYFIGTQGQSILQVSILCIVTVICAGVITNIIKKLKARKNALK